MLIPLKIKYKKVAYHVTIYIILTRIPQL
jgi:hypothetical protein